MIFVSKVPPPFVGHATAPGGSACGHATASELWLNTAGLVDRFPCRPFRTKFSHNRPLPINLENTVPLSFFPGLLTDSEFWTSALGPNFGLALLVAGIIVARIYD